MNNKFSPFNNFVGGALRFFFPKTQRSAPKGIMTVGTDNIVRIDPQDVVILEDGNYTVKPGDRRLICPAYLKEVESFNIITLPDPTEWKGRTLSLVSIAWFAETDEFGVTWVLSGTFVGYSTLYINTQGQPQTPGSVGNTVPPFDSAAIMGSMITSSVAKEYNLFSDGTGWTEEDPETNLLPYTP